MTHVAYCKTGHNDLRELSIEGSTRCSISHASDLTKWLSGVTRPIGPTHWPDKVTWLSEPTYLMAVAHWWQMGILAVPAVAGSVRASPALPTLIVRGPVGTWGRQDDPPEGAGAAPPLKDGAEGAADGPLLIIKKPWSLSINLLFIQFLKNLVGIVYLFKIVYFIIYSFKIIVLVNLFVYSFIKFLK